jgi:hypothetical protein
MRGLADWVVFIPGFSVILRFKPVSKFSMTDSKAAKAAAKVLRLSHNEWSNKYFAIAIGAIMILFAVFHWSSVLYFHYGPKKRHPALTRKYRYVHSKQRPVRY